VLIGNGLLYWVRMLILFVSLFSRLVGRFFFYLEYINCPKQIMVLYGEYYEFSVYCV